MNPTLQLPNLCSDARAQWNSSPKPGYLNQLPHHWISGIHAPAWVELSFGSNFATIYQVLANVDQGNPGFRVDQVLVMLENAHDYQQVDLWIGERVQNDQVKSHLHHAIPRVKSLRIETTCLTNNWVGWYSIQVLGFLT